MEPHKTIPDTALGRWIDLDWPLNHLLNSRSANHGHEHKGIALPADDDPGTGNIVICGRAGTGKSTLAMQIAVAAAQNPLRFDKSDTPPRGEVTSLYIAMEEPVQAIRQKAQKFQWGAFVAELRHFGPGESLSSPRALSDDLKRIIAADAARNGRVWVCSLSPRPVVTPTDAGALFKERFAQMERLVVAAAELNSDRDHRGEIPRVGLVCIDSLSMFGFPPENREAIFRLFDLLRRHGLIGIFISGDDDGARFDSTLADVVIHLTMEEDQGYVLRYLEVEKSRHVEHPRGRHPFKIGVRPIRPDASKAPYENEPSHSPELRSRSGLLVYPSVHWTSMLRATDPGTADRMDPPRISQPRGVASPMSMSAEPSMGRILGADAFDRILPKRASTPQVLLFKGPAGTFKSVFATNFLVHGLVSKPRESGLFIRLANRTYFQVSDILKRPLSEQTLECLRQSKDEPCHQPTQLPSGFSWDQWIDPNKASVKQWTYGAGNSAAHLIEIDFYTGNLLPEEFVQAVDFVMARYRQDSGRPICRVALDDVSCVGVSYPLLRRAHTTGSEFLPLLVRIMRNHNVRLVMAGTTGELADANEPVDRAEATADVVITCDYCHVFGDRYVSLSGTGLRTSDPADTASGPEAVPLVVRLGSEAGERSWHLDPTSLQGLVGFGTERIRRPGIVLHMFSEYYDIEPFWRRGVHHRYNQTVATLIRSALGRPASAEQNDSVRDPATPDVSLDPFGSETSGIVHSSLGLVRGPLDRTVLYTLDEFWDSDGKTRDRLARLSNPADKHIVKWNPETDPVRPYYSNVLLLACRKDAIRANITQPDSWKEVLQWVKKAALGADGNSAFMVDSTAPETLACALMDALMAGKARSYRGSDRYPRALEWLSKVVFREPSNTWLNDASIRAELTALATLLRSAPRGGPNGKTAIEPGAAVYLCWYSQLRDLVTRYPEIGHDLRVFALPARGFRGDWFLGVARGSVSVQLGQDIIDILCSRKEQYRRFVDGVGLPTFADFREPDAEFLAWPRSIDAPLSDIIDMHQNAHSRANIADYQTFRSALATIASRLIIPEAGPPRPLWDQIKQNIQRLPGQIRVLRTSGGTGRSTGN